MPVYISPNQNREVWAEKPDGYYTEEEWKACHSDRFYSVVGTSSCRGVCYPYDGIHENEVEVAGFPPDDISISTVNGEWIHSEELLNEKFVNLRNLKLDELNTKFNRVSENAHCMSSTGFEINADDSANRNISSLIISMEATGQQTVRFCAYDNSFHDVTLSQLKVMQLEIIANAQTLYQKKWALREQIFAAETVEELAAVDIVFVKENDDGTGTRL